MRPTMLPTRVRQGYGFGAFALAVANTSALFFLFKFLVDGAGLEPFAAGTVLLVGKAWDAVSDPLIGRLSDATKTSMGARRPWMAAGSVPFALVFAALWWGLPVSGTAAIVVYAVLLVLYNTAYTVVVVPYGALTPSLTADYDERTALNGARMAWSMVGGLVAGIAFPVLLETSGGYRVPGLVMGALLAPPLLVAVWVTRGRDRGAEPSGQAMWSVLRNSAFRRVSALFLCAWTSIALLSALVPFYVEHHIGDKTLLDAVFGTIQLSALAFVPITVWAAGRLEKHIAYAIAVAGWAVVLLGLAAVPAGASMVTLLVAAALVGPGIAAAHVLPWSMLPDVVEADAAENGAERAGAFYGVMTFLEKTATALALWGMGAVLQLAGYVKEAAVQPESAQLAIRLLIGPVPGAILVIAALLAWRRPPIGRDAHRALVARLRPGAQGAA